MHACLSKKKAALSRGGSLLVAMLVRLAEVTSDHVQCDHETCSGRTMTVHSHHGRTASEVKTPVEDLVSFATKSGVMLGGNSEMEGKKKKDHHGHEHDVDVATPPTPRGGSRMTWSHPTALSKAVTFIATNNCKRF